MIERQNFRFLKNISQTIVAACIFLAPAGNARAESEVKVDFEMTCRQEAMPLDRFPNPWFSIRGISGISEEDGEVFLLLTNNNQETGFGIPYFEYMRGFQEAGGRGSMPLADLQDGQRYTVSVHRVSQRTPFKTILEQESLYERSFWVSSCRIPYNIG